VLETITTGVLFKKMENNPFKCIVSLFLPVLITIDICISHVMQIDGSTTLTFSHDGFACLEQMIPTIAGI
jgi:hypothetical protein